MSSLFADTMRAAIYCNASGLGPETPEQEASRLRHEAERAGLCNEDWDWGFPCGEPKDHEGDHISRGDDWEMRWRRNP